MGEVLCVATWNEKKERELSAWVDARSDRYVIWAVEEKIMPHSRMYQVDESDLSLQQVALELLYLPFVYEDSSHPVLQRLARIQTELHLRASDFLDQGVKLLTNYQMNLQKPVCLATDCFEKLSGYPAVVCGAGPSLKEALPFLKQYRDHFLIIGCGAGMQALVSAGVQPHLVVHVDPDPYHRFQESQIPLFFQLRTSPEVVQKMKGARFVMAGSGNFLLERWIEEKLGLATLFDGGWTAATQGVSLAEALDCNGIYFAGMDFASSSAGLYAKGVDASQENSLIKVSLKDGTTLQTRSDWLLAAEWLNTWVLKHPYRKCGVVSTKNPLMPDIPVVNLQECIGQEGVFSALSEVFAACTPREGKRIWAEVQASFAKCRLLIDQFLARLQMIFPESPREDQACMTILDDLDHQLTTQKILDSIWQHWEVVLKRQSENHPDALIVHRVLLLKSLADRFYA